MSQEDAHQLDATDPLRCFRDRFNMPPSTIYFCGHSLGLQPKGVHQSLQHRLDQWAMQGIDAWFTGDDDWYTLTERLSKRLEPFVGAAANEVVVMNNLTTNLHLMLHSFYRPQGKRTKIIVDTPLFPSDRFALESHLRAHGYDPSTTLIGVDPLTEDIAAVLDHHQGSVALLFFSGVNFLTGQLHDMASLAQLARNADCFIGLDLAHAIGNVPLQLHEWGIDFAVWCSYKYLNAGPGAVGGCFVHQRHHAKSLPRLAGWWGHDPTRRFRMHLEPSFAPQQGAFGWQLATPSVLSLAALEASLDLFEEAETVALYQKGQRLSAFLRQRLTQVPQIEIITPASHGCQISFCLPHKTEALHQHLKAHNITGDYRPGTLRWAPVPLYNTFSEIDRAVACLQKAIRY